MKLGTKMIVLNDNVHSPRTTIIEHITNRPINSRTSLGRIEM